MIRMAREINDQKPELVASKAIDLLNHRKGKKVGILGVAYKANVDDCRETPAAPLLAIFHENGIEVRFHDPYVQHWKCRREEIDELDNWADLIVLVTDHQEYQYLNLNTDLLNTRGQ